ncbi:MAG TPA: type II toxin-antitoxin system prevent-host-death family antitoxin [Clostridiales bacterium]|nr:type II toxin-antitoxin system prevent-host-death family antitoxin [Clostridiales bacterium]
MEVPSTEVQNNFGQYMKFAFYEDIIVTRNGKRAVVIKRYEEDNEKGIKGTILAEKAQAYNLEDLKISYEDFIKLTEESDNRYEYIDGEVYLLASPSYNHQSIIVEILNTMYNRFKGEKCKPLTAPFDVTLLKEDNKNVVQPDILVICDTVNINEKGRYTGIPSLVLEVLSETTKHKDLLKKLDLYIHSGISEYWIVNPFKKEIYVYYIEDKAISEYEVYKGNEGAKSILFKGLEISLEQIFEF